jgi:3',5'-cyclic AMP phosphodiesterase CpdA
MSDRLFRFFQWNDMHIRDRDVPGRSAGYPNCNEKAAWAVECAQGKRELEPPDFIASAGDIICGEIEDYSVDFRFMDRHLIDPLDVPLLPCLGNHENRQGEGIPEQNVAYDRRYGPGWHNYLYTIGGIAFIVIDSTGAHREGDEITAARNAFLERAFARAGSMPVLVLTHVPLIAMRDEAALLPSFGFSSWKILDEALLTIIEAHADQVIAVLCGHIHLTGAKKRRGIYHIMPSGTAGYPADFAAYDVYADRVEVEMQRAPDELIGDQALGDIHGARRHGIDYTDADHPDHESYMSGKAGERCFTIELDSGKQPSPAAPQGLTILHETGTGDWREVQLPG